MTIRISDAHGPRLARMQPAAVRPVLADSLDRGAQSLVEHARLNIEDGAISGPGHVAGPVGGFPNSDTHELAESLHKGPLIETIGDVRTSAIADAPYARLVHNGTSRAGPRPFMSLTVAALRTVIVQSLHERFIRQVKP